MRTANCKTCRTGGVYIAVLGTSLMVTLLGLSALMAQRIQNRITSTSADIRQAELNANTAVELALLTMKQNSNWRTVQPHGSWFSGRGTGAGTCSVEVTDPLDSNLANNPDDPILVRGIGYQGQAQQRFEISIDPRRQPTDVLRAGAAAGGQIAGQNSLDWTAIANAFSTGATAITYNTLPTADQFEFARNVSLNSNLDHWDNDPPGLPQASFNGPNGFSGHSAAMRVDRNDKRAGAGNRLQVGLLKPNTTYQVSVEVHPELSALQTNRFKVFMITEYANGTYFESLGSTTTISWLANVWTTLTATITTPAWTEEPTNVYLVVNSDHVSGNTYRFWIDNLHVCETTTGRFLYNQALGPSVANPNGLYRIDCGNNKLVIERSRILGTLVVVNPGPGTCIANGPIRMSPATAGYPALVVSGNFTIRATNRALNEDESVTNFNPSALPYEFNNLLANATDTANNDSYPSEIQGLVAVSGNLTYENQPRIRGQVIVGGSISSSASFVFQLESMLNPPTPFYTYRQERRPVSGRKAVLP